MTFLPFWCFSRAHVTDDILPSTDVHVGCRPIRDIIFWVRFFSKTLRQSTYVDFTKCKIRSSISRDVVQFKTNQYCPLISTFHEVSIDVVHICFIYRFSYCFYIISLMSFLGNFVLKRSKKKIGNNDFSRELPMTVID